jgi:diguanylate cyclase (GGDEF)-like protein/PAS domain S-box-containing protein
MRALQRWRKAGWILWLVVCACPVWADAPLHFGVLAFRGKVETEAQWRPLADHLERVLPAGRRVEVRAYDFPALAEAITRNEVDILLTNPGDYTLLRHRNGVSAPLVTLVRREGANDLTGFGGVIFTRADTSVLTLADASHQRIAAVQPEAFGGYQMQAFEMLEAGLEVPSGEQVLYEGLPHDNVVRAVLEGRAEVGFVRTGLLERMAAEGKLDLNRLRILNRQNLVGYPYAASTRLYPEWPVAVMPQVGEDLARQLSVALLSLAPDSPAARAAGLHGFTVPADYTGVENLLRKLRRPPFDVTPEFTLEDLWKKYRAWMAVLGAMVLLLGGVVWRLVLQNKHMRQTQLRLDLAIQGTGLGIWDSDLVSGENYYSPRMYEMLGYAPDEFPHNPTSWTALIHPDDLAQVLTAEYAVTPYKLPVYAVTMRMRAKNGAWRWIQTQGVVQNNALGQPIRRTGLHVDVTDRMHDQERVVLAASVFTHAREGIMITLPDGAIVEVNEAFTRITGYTREEAMGKNPSMLKSGRQSAGFYESLWQELLSTGHWSGEIWNRHRDGGLYAELMTISAVQDAAGQTHNYVALFTDITPIKEHQRLLEHIAHYDTLTNLPNRVLLADRLQQAMRQCQRNGRSLAVVFLDLDGFKRVNDAYGHDVGDDLLVALSQRMKSTLRESDTLARIGGDEFIAVLVDLERVQDCEPLLQRMLQAAADPVPMQSPQGALTLQVSASMGITLYPQDGADADQLMRHADQAMYQAKQAGKNRYQLFDVDKDAAVSSHHETMVGIAQALERDEFVLHYQPKVNMRTGDVVGVEALIRWQHPERGLLPPGVFLPGIELDPVGVQLGEWVIRAALMQASAWKAQGLYLPISVNVDAYQLQHADFVSHLQALLAAYPDVHPGQIELEVLETSAMQDIARVSETMRACQAMGVQFALDDFGTGYSSLTYLKRLPAHTLKIDQSFVRDMLDDPDDLAIVDGVVGLARAFGRAVIAEGVETQAHGRRLVALGCDCAQGYGIARPMPASQLVGWLDQWKHQSSWINS